MIEKEIIINKIMTDKIIAIVRVPETTSIIETTEAIFEGGIRMIEYSLTIPRALDCLRQAVTSFGHKVIIGVGTVTKVEQIYSACEIGARFVVTPVYKPELIAACKDNDAVCVCGALTPTEIFNAWENGTDFIKVFPASAFGPRYIRELLVPLSHLRLVPTGGVSIENVSDYISSGAAAVAIGSQLVDPNLVKQRDFEQIATRAKRFKQLGELI